MPRSEDIVDRDLAIFAHGVVNISEFATFLPFLASETKVCKRSKTGNRHSWTLPRIGLRAGRNSRCTVEGDESLPKSGNTKHCLYLKI